MKYFDGAFGTYYISKTADYGFCELANLNNTEAVLSIHKEYIACGVNAITTNTFKANPGTFDEPILTRVITEGFRLAVEAAAGTNVKVFADIGGVGDEDAEFYLRVADIFIGLGAENFIFETLPGFSGIEAALARIKENNPSATTAVSFAVSQNGYSADGSHYKALAEQAFRCEAADIVGLNCVCGPTHLLDLSRNMSNTPKPVLIMPNAGYPSYVNGRLMFRDNAEYFAEKMHEISKLGIELLGGCCGTTPMHIKKMIELAENGAEVASMKARTVVSARLNELKMKPIMVELDPPLDCCDAHIISSAKALMDCGVKTITLADSPLSRARADSILTAARLRTEAGVDVLPHITCRDRNSVALRGALLGAYFFNIDKILVITGDPLTDVRSSAVFNFNSTQLISYINNMNKEVFGERPFSIGAALNVNALNFAAELERAKKKSAAGADFFLTQPIFSSESIANFKLARKELDCRLYAGILPVASYGNAIFLNNEVPGIRIPSEVIEQLKGLDKDEARAVSIRHSADIMSSVYEADGFYIIAPLRRVDMVCDLINGYFRS